MPNDDGLKEYLNEHSLEIFLGDGAPSVRTWLFELLDAREKIAAMQHGIRFYIERNIELTGAVCDAKTNLEYWVTQAGMWEAKARGNEEKK